MIPERLLVQAATIERHFPTVEELPYPNHPTAAHLLLKPQCDIGAIIMNQPAAEADEVVVIALDLEVEGRPRFGDAFDRDDRFPFAGAVSKQIARFERLRRDPVRVIRRQVVPVAVNVERMPQCYLHRLRLAFDLNSQKLAGRVPEKPYNLPEFHPAGGFIIAQHAVAGFDQFDRNKSLVGMNKRAGDKTQRASRVVDPICPSKKTSERNEPDGILNGFPEFAPTAFDDRSENSERNPGNGQD